MAEILHRSVKPLRFSRHQLSIPGYLEGASIRYQEQKELPGLAYPKLSVTRIEQLAFLIAHPEMVYEDQVAKDLEQYLPNLVDIQKGHAVHLIQLLGQVWRWCLPYHSEGSRREYPILYMQKLQTIATALPTISADDIVRFITLLSDEQLGTDPSTHDGFYRNRRLRAYEIIADRVLEDMFRRSPFTDMPSLPYDRDNQGEWPCVDPSAFCALWNTRGASEEIMQQTHAIFDYHEQLPYMPGVDDRGLSGLEVRFSLLFHNLGAQFTGHIDQLHRDSGGLTLVDFKSGQLHVPTHGVQSDALHAALSLTACAARTFTRADLQMPGHAIELTNYDLAPPESEPVHIYYMSFHNGGHNEYGFPSFKYLWNTSRGLHIAEAHIETLLEEVDRDSDRLGHLIQ